jgi:hypothetical protein
MLVLSNSQVHFFLCIINVSVRFTKNHFFASFSHVDLFFKDEVEGMHRTTPFPVAKGDDIPDNFLPTALLEKWENLEVNEGIEPLGVAPSSDRTLLSHSTKIPFLQSSLHSQFA